MRKKRTAFEGEPGHEHCSNATFLFGQRAKLSLGQRIKIVGRVATLVRDPQAVEAFLEFPHRRGAE
jgi:hypothetical protein